MPRNIEEFLEVPEVEEIIDAVEEEAGEDTYTFIRVGVTGQTESVRQNEPMTLRDLLAAGRVLWTPETHFYLEGQDLTMDDVVPAGAQLDAVGTIKAG